MDLGFGEEYNYMYMTLCCAINDWLIESALIVDVPDNDEDSIRTRTDTYDDDFE